MDIVLCTDTNYILPAQVTICSVCVNNPNEQLTFHVVTDAVSRQSVEKLAVAINQWHQEVRFYTMDVSKCNCLPFGRSDQPGHASMASYYRLFLASLLPEAVEKVIYLDCDMIVRQSLTSLWAIDLSGYAVGCVDDMSNLDPSKFNTLRYYPSEGYFNAGMLLVNLAYWREHELEDRFLEFARQYPERIVFHDQDVMNYVLRKEKMRLPLMYNVQDGFLYDTIHFLVWPYEDEYEQAIKKPCIIHYSIRFKPWHADSEHPWKEEYRKYVRMAGLELKDFPQRKEKKNLYQRFRPVLVKMGLLSPLVTFRKDVALGKA